MKIFKDKKIILILITIMLLIIITFLILKPDEKKYEDNNVTFQDNYTIKEHIECDSKYTLYYDDNNHKRENPNDICIDKVTLTTSKVIKDLQQEIDSIINKYDSKICNNQNIHYDSNKNITIFKYELISKNEIVIEYMKGKINNDDCNLIKNIENIEYKYDYSYYYPLNPDIKKSFSYIGTDNKVHDVYSDCGNCLTIKNGQGTYAPFRGMLGSSYIDMETLILFLEHESNKGITTKTTNEIGTLYSNDEFQLFVCGNDINNNIYISDEINPSDIKC